jgi:hypothetical protein
MKPILRQRGIALPVMLLMLLMMLVTSIFLLKSINSATLMAGNVAYESALGKAADVGLVTGFRWLSTQAKTNKSVFIANIPTEGYTASFDTTLKVRDPLFWTNKKTITDNGNTIEYVIHRLCPFAGAYNVNPNHCVQTASSDLADTGVPIGDSVVGDSTSFPAAPQVHYIITSRISGPRGGNVVNQLVVMIGA